MESMRWTGGVQCSPFPLWVSRHASRLPYAASLQEHTDEAGMGQGVGEGRDKKSKSGMNILLGAPAVAMPRYLPLDLPFCLDQRGEGLGLSINTVLKITQPLDLGEHFGVSSGPAFGEVENLQVIPVHRLENGIFCGAVWLLSLPCWCKVTRLSDKTGFGQCVGPKPNAHEWLQMEWSVNMS